MFIMNKLDIQDQVRIVSALVEGVGINATCRMTGVAKNTVLKLLRELDYACECFHDEHVQNLRTKRVQVDEIWSFCHSKQKNVRPENFGKMHGDVWTWTALDADSKLIVCWTVGGRDAKYGNQFVGDLASRLSDRIQLTSDGWQVYREAVKKAFGSDVDYAMLVKEYARERLDSYARYSPPECVGCHTTVHAGNPDQKHINTSYVERHNLTMRMHMRRFTRLTNAHSKKISNHCAALALYFMHYNFCKIHQTIRCTPAMEAGLTDHVWELDELLALLEKYPLKSAPSNS
jgi:IS1 family transposase